MGHVVVPTSCIVILLVSAAGLSTAENARVRVRVRVCAA